MQITIIPTYKQHLAYEALKTHREVFFGGAAGGGKTWVLCESRLINCYLHPGYKSFIGREELKRLMSSTFMTWVKVCSHHKIPLNDWKLNGSYNFIEFKNGSRIDLLDLKYLPSDPLFERFGSLEYTDGAIEECGEIHFLAKDVLGTRIGRHLNDELKLKPTLFLTGNPKKNWTYRDFYKPWKDGTLTNDIAFIQALFRDNQYTSKDYEIQLNSIKDTSTKERLMFGNWDYDSDPNAMISYEKIAAIWTNDHVPSGSKYIICDVARYGSDSAIITVWDGYRLVEYKTFAISSTVEIQNCINALRQKYQVPASNCIADDDGVGGGVVDNCRIVGFVNNSKAIDATYFNLKTECGYKLAENIYKIFIACDVSSTVKDKIEQELGQLKTYDADKDGKLKILPKEKIKENIGRSPDWLDIFTMRMYPEIKPNYKPAKFNF